MHMNKLHPHSFGMAAGSTAALLHALLAISVAAMPDVTQKLINLDVALHFMKMDVMVQPFSAGGAVALIILAFCVAYVVGRIFAAVYNSFARGR